MDAPQTSIFIAVLITSITLAVVMGYFIVIILRQQRQKNKLYRAKILAEITTLENERARIANDLHDEMGPILSSVKLRANNIDIRSKDDQEELDVINKNIDEMMIRMRAISNDLLPNTLRRKGLIAAINEFASRSTVVNGPSITFLYDEPFPELPKEKNVNLFRIVQEITHNTIKHANAKKLTIELRHQKEMIYLLTSDNGTGFDYETLMRESSGLGLRSLLSRAEVMGGELFVASGPGKGTKFSFEIPLYA